MLPCVLLVSLLQLRRSFDALDQDHDGFITSIDLLNLQQQLLGQHHMTKELAEDMMSEVSTCISDTHDGKMDFEEVRGLEGVVTVSCTLCNPLSEISSQSLASKAADLCPCLRLCIQDGTDALPDAVNHLILTRCTPVLLYCCVYCSVYCSLCT